MEERYFREAGRWLEIPVGLFALAAGGFGLVFGAKGYIAYAHGSRAAPADPFACTIGVLGGLIVCFYGLKLVFNWSRHGVLITNAALPLAALACFGMAAWLLYLGHELGTPLSEELRPVYGAVLVGSGALVLWWRRLKGAG
jgi:hypothetical protein